MANEWISEPKDSAWLDKKEPIEPSPLKTLTDLGDERQKASETPKPEPIIEPIEPLEVIPYEKVIPSLENAASDVLASFSRLGRASVNLSKISIVVADAGPKSKELLNKAEMFKTQVDQICLELSKISEEIAEYKNSLPKDSVAKI